MTPQISPFPGMAPYLEERWPEVHASLIVYARNQLNPQLPANLQVRIEQTVEVYEDDDYSHSRRPDLDISESDSGGVATATAVAIATVEVPLIVAREPEFDRNLEIVDATGRIITAIEFISPWNKIGSRARARYMEKQQEFFDARINLVEIDLVRRGEYILAAPEHMMPESVRAMNLVSVFRGNAPDQFEIYRAPLRKRLPNIPVPLRRGERDAVLQLQPLIDDCYRDGHFWRTNYQNDPDPPLSPADAAWLDALLREQGRRK